MKNKILNSLISAIEWYDFALYGFFGQILSFCFFPPNTPYWSALLATYSIFAISFMARPAGGLIFSHFGDKFGRMIALRFTPLLMTISTIMIACLPTFASIGIYAPVLLTIIRLVQGMIIGGEFSGNIVYLFESSQKSKYFWGSIGSCSGSFGIICASLVASQFYQWINHASLYSYGWRMGFLLTVPFSILAYFYRIKLKDTKESSMLRKKNREKFPIVFVLKHQQKILLTCISLMTIHAIGFYFTFIFLPQFFIQARHLSESFSLINNTWFLLFHLLSIPVFSKLADTFGGPKILKLNCLSFMLFGILAYILICYGNNFFILIGVFILSMLTALNSATIPGLISQMSNIATRYTIIALSFNIGFGFLGGITPVISLFFFKKYGMLSPALLLLIGSAITYIATIRIPPHETW